MRTFLFQIVSLITVFRLFIGTDSRITVNFSVITERFKVTEEILR